MGGTCKICQTDVRTGGNTTNLRNHLKRKHEKTLSEVNELDVIKKQRLQSEHNNTNECEDESILITDIESASSSTSTFSTLSTVSTNKSEIIKTNIKHNQPLIDKTIMNMRAYEGGGVKHGQITNGILFMIAKNNLPFNTVEKEGFQYLMKMTVPLYKVPGRKKITILMEEKYELLSNIMKVKLSVIEHVCLTTDVWTDTLNTRSYLELTVHFASNGKLNSVVIGVTELNERHTSDYLGQWLSQICTEWHIKKDNITAIVTDNAANITKAINDVFGKNKHLPYELRKHETKKLIQSVPTRWNSVYYMLEQFVELSESISLTLLKFPKAPSMLSASELQLAKDIMQVMSPIEAATKEICGEHYTTGSKVIPLINCLKKKINNLSFDLISPTALKLLDSLSANINMRFGAVEQVTILAISTILDPRFKKLHFNNSIVCSQAINKIAQKMETLNNNIPRKENIATIATENASLSNDIWSFHEDLANNIQYINNESDEIPTDLKHYLNQPTIGIDFIREIEHPYFDLKEPSSLCQRVQVSQNTLGIVAWRSSHYPESRENSLETTHGALDIAGV
ncbi:PREDICTED: uncharacterized protein LOC105459036, partial [Wasmannia auropunctata]|uniref:uncharacterized protein LOC105459036 n=1 Tax=Wasmannia auropunctata TaxID=64793 RepID=UPI0005EF2F4D